MLLVAALPNKGLVNFENKNLEAIEKKKEILYRATF